MNYRRIHWLLLALAACGPETHTDFFGSESTSSGAAEPQTTTEAAPTTGEPAPATATTDEPATTALEPTTTDPSAGSETTADTGEATDGTAGTTGADALELDPETLVTFALPIDSLRYAVSGHDAAHGLCVSLIFTNSSIDHQLHCDVFDPGALYVVIEPGAGPCMNWDYDTGVELLSVAGCMQLVSEDPAQIDLDMTLQVSGALFTGEIHVANE